MDKAPDAFRTISEVADEIDVQQHVLRFWESRFQQIRPMKRGGGRRYYRPDDVDLLRGVRHLLYGEGYTIRGVQRILREQGAGFVQDVWRAGAAPPPPELEDDQAADDDAAEANITRATATHADATRANTTPANATHANAMHDGGAAMPLPRSEPNLFALVPPPSSRPSPAAAPATNNGERAHEPVVVPTAAFAGTGNRAVTDEDRRKLKSALDELVACRAIIDTALRQS